MAAIVSLQFMIFTMVILGFILMKTGLVNAEGRKSITNLVLYVTVPCSVVNSFFSGVTPQLIKDCVSIFFIACFLELAMILYGKVRYGAAPEGEQVNLRLGLMISNASLMGIPLAEGVFGEIGPIMASVYMIPLNFLIFTTGLAMYSGEADRRKAIKTVVTHPCVLSCVIGILIMLSGVTFPEIIVQPIRMIGRCNTVLSMMIAGFIIGEMKQYVLPNRRVIFFTIERLILIPLALFLILRLLPVSKETVGVSTLLTAMPCAAVVSVMAAKYERRPDFSAQLVMLTTILSLPTILVWSMIIRI